MIKVCDLGGSRPLRSLRGRLGLLFGGLLCGNLLLVSRRSGRHLLRVGARVRRRLCRLRILFRLVVRLRLLRRR